MRMRGGPGIHYCFMQDFELECEPLVLSQIEVFFNQSVPYAGFAFVCLKIQHSTDSFQYLAVGDLVDFLLDRNL
jgi:hypothetical protein